MCSKTVLQFVAFCLFAKSCSTELMAWAEVSPRSVSHGPGQDLSESTASAFSPFLTDGAESKINQKQRGPTDSINLGSILII